MVLDSLHSLLRFSSSQTDALSSTWRTAFGFAVLMLFILVSLPAAAQGGPSVGIQATIPFPAPPSGGDPDAPSGVAVDESGNLFITDLYNSRVIEEPAGCSSTSCEVTIQTSAFMEPAGVAIDASGDLFIADLEGKVWEVPSGCSLGSCTTTIGTGWGEPTGVALDSNGNLYVADFSKPAVVEVPWTGSSWGTQATIASWLPSPYGVAIDKSNNLFVSDYNDQEVLELSVSCISEGIAGAGANEGCQTTVASVSSWSANPKGIAVDGSGNVFLAAATGTAATDLVAEVPVGSYGCSTTSCLTGFGYGLSAPAGVALGATGDVIITDRGNGRALMVRQNSFSFGSVAVGSASTTVTAYFDFNSSETLDSTPYQVLTQGQTGLDFADAGSELSSGCAAASYSSGNTCIVNLHFTPAAPGLRLGALQLEDSFGNPLATANVYGIGSGPQVSFPSNVIRRVVGSGFSLPANVAVDTAGDVFVADSGDNAVKEIVAVNGQVSSSSTVNTVGSGFSGPGGVAVDGSGNVFVADYGNNAVKEIVAVSGQVSSASTVNTVGSGFNGPGCVAVDGSGNVFVADYGNGAVKEIVAASGQVTSSSTVNTVGSGFSGPAGVSVDAAGDVFVADYGNNAVKEIVAVNGQVSSSSTVNTVGSGFSGADGVAVDASGDVFVADQNNNLVKEIVAVNGQVSSSSAVETLGWEWAAPAGVAVDASGDVFVADQYENAVKEMPLATPPSITFPSGTEPGTTDTTDGPLSATVANNGNATLTFNLTGSDNPSLSTSNFTWDDSASTCIQTTSGSSTAFTLAEGASCTLAVDFTPTVIGTLTDNLSLTDNSLNATSATQQIPLSGTAAIAATMTSPMPGSTLASASTTFIWSAGSGGVTAYFLHVGTTPGAADLVNIGVGTNTSATVTLPTNGATIYVQLQTVINGSTSLFTSYTYKEFTISGGVITSPAPGGTLTSASTTFRWNAGTGGVTAYFLHIGTTSGAADLVNMGVGTSTSATVTLPTNGATIYVQLETHIGATVIENNNTYTEFTISGGVITSPAPGGTLTSASTIFRWNAGTGGVTAYFLHIGTTSGAADLVNMGVGTSTSATVTLPTNGATIYVQLETHTGGTVIENNNTYTESVSGGVITSPTPGSTLTSASTTFIWSAGTGGVTAYFLHIGTSPGGADLVNMGVGTSTSATVTLPTNGATIYVQLETHIGATVIENNNTYTESVSGGVITSPTPGSTLTSASTTFTWSAGTGGVTAYFLHIGTSPGGADLVNMGVGTSTSATVTLPTNGATIYVQLETHIGATVIENNNTYTEFTISGGVITSPAPGSTLTLASTTFKWNAGTGGVTAYFLHIGTTSGGANLVNIYLGTSTSATVTLPTNGATIYVQLETHIGATVIENNNTYTEFTQ